VETDEPPIDRPPGTRPKDPPIVEWYRLDASRSILRTLMLGASIMLLGSIVSAWGLFSSRGSIPHPLLGHRGAVLAAEAAQERSPLLEVTTGLLALGCLVGGGFTAILGLKRALFVSGETERFVAWDDLEDVSWDARTDALLFVGHDGEAVPLVARFADVTNEELARRVRAVRRRAVHGLLPSRSKESPEA
jgi:hypothetical protein